MLCDEASDARDATEEMQRMQRLVMQHMQRDATQEMQRKRCNGCNVSSQHMQRHTAPSLAVSKHQSRQAVLT